MAMAASGIDNQSNSRSWSTAIHTSLMKRLAPFAGIRSYHRDEEIYSQGRPADFWYRLISGVARLYGFRADGRRQIVDLLFPDDFFGFTPTANHRFTAEAGLEGTKVASFARQRLEGFADSDPQLAREMRHVAFEALFRVQAHLLTVGQITAPEKVGSFLLELADRSTGASADQIKLPISRHDIADYLALSVETVSRSLTDLKNRGVINLLGARMVVIIDREALGHWQRRPSAHAA